MHHLTILLGLGLLCLTLDPKVGLNINNTVVYTNRSTYRTNMCVGCFNISSEAKTSGESLLAYYKNQFSGYLTFLMQWDVRAEDHIKPAELLNDPASGYLAHTGSLAAAWDMLTSSVADMALSVLLLRLSM